ncbi:MAG: M56 family metallopeptidase [Rikenellaceae bacterium]
MITGALGVYLIEASILLIILYLFNNWLLSQETAHRMNRAVWLISIVFSFALPFVSLQSVDYIEPMAGITFGEIAVESEIAAQAGAPAIFSLYNIVNTLLFIYLCGVVVCAIYMFIGYFSLISLVYNGRYNLSNSANAEDKTLLYRLIGYQRFAAVDRDIRYVIHDNDNLSPFSWFNSVVVSRSDIEANDREIILHELSHISQRHSLDVLLLNLATIILWFNPASWLTKRALQQVHEYCADDAVLSLGINVKEYQLLLIRKAVGARLYSMSNSLNHSNLKNRITMMTKKKSPKMMMAKCLYAIPVAIFAIFIFASPALADSVDAVSEVKITNYFEQFKNFDLESTPYGDNITEVEVVTHVEKMSQDTTNVEKVWLRSEVMPKFQGGDLRDFRDWVMARLRYPAEAAKNNIQGMVTMKFVVEKDGSIGNVEVARSPDSQLSEEAERVILSSPKWTPGEQDGEKVRVTYMLPVVFKISNDDETEK